MRPAYPRCVHLTVLLFSLLTSQALCWKCNVNETVCEIWLELEHHVTMMNGKSLLIIKDGLLFPYDTVNFTKANSIPKEHVITADGWPEPRVVIAVNGTVPGPTLEVHEHQIVRLHLKNKLESEATSLHFHGQFQKGTPWMDGVSFVTQCPLLPGQTFTQQFRAEPAGTFWYHAHTGSQSSMGMQGGFVVHPRTGASDSYHRQFTLLLHDWNHDWDSTMGFMKMQYGMYVHGKKEAAQSNLSGAKYSMHRCQSGLINGRGRYHDPVTGKHNHAPLETFTVRQGNVYRFRIIHSGAVYPFQVWVHGHRLKVVATDGNELREPLLADSVIVVPGERYDFEINATNSVNNYWIKTRTLELGKFHIGEAILHYEGASEDTDPTTKEGECTSSFPCVAVNCPFLYFPAENHTICVNTERLHSAEKISHNVGLGAEKIKEYFVNFAFPGTSWTPASVNGVQFEMPHVSALTQPQEFHTRCPGEGYRCTEDNLCRCTNVVDVAEGEVVQFVVTNLGLGKGWDHPLHMHGHSFWVLKIGYPEYDKTTGRFLRDNTDIDCRGHPDRDRSYCNNATWAEPSWSGNAAVPGLDLYHPVLKDTVNVPTGGYVVVRIRADNPGLWMMHCHVSLHQSDGMVLLLNESYPNHPPPPPGFQKCGDFNLPAPSARRGGNGADYPRDDRQAGEKDSSAGSKVAVSRDLVVSLVVVVACLFGR
ncbi:uncharacterized protein [Littorina saxatilis]|uniref:Uncharacterized protein n=1 Tax=Littorina saxatilis TaxID=31220 RepID=A0AAN9BBZ4_9CAEN